MSRIFRIVLFIVHLHARKPLHGNLSFSQQILHEIGEKKKGYHGNSFLASHCKVILAKR